MTKELRFVTKYYRQGSLDIRSAYRATLAKAGRSPSASIRWVAIAAAVAVLVVAGAVALFYSRQATITTILTANESRVVRLADGTSITLAPHSSVSYDEKDCRSIELSGKAYLNIHHDDAHPFVITDDDYVIRDIGTQLVVDEKTLTDGQKTTSVYVIEGSVSLMANGGSKGAIVDKGDMYQIGSGTMKPRRISKVPTENAVAAWATHEFHFSDTPLPTVLSDLSDYYGVILTCPNGGNKRLTADFHADSLTTIINLIEETLNVKIKQTEK